MSAKAAKTKEDKDASKGKSFQVELCLFWRRTGRALLSLGLLKRNKGLVGAWFSLGEVKWYLDKGGEMLRSCKIQPVGGI